MGRKSELYNTAKQLLNYENINSYSDDEINKIIKLLENMSEVICHNLTH